MKVVIPALREDCPAALALWKEGIPYEVVLMEDEYSYSRFLCLLWEEARDFILLEHDIVPWPGALTALEECPFGWCSYRYPLAPFTLRPALGCIKVLGWIQLAHPELPDAYRWAGRIWTQMDGAVCPALESIIGPTHIHNPPVAHVKK